MAMFVNADKGVAEEKAPSPSPALEVSGEGGNYTIVASKDGKLHCQEAFKGGVSEQNENADAAFVAAEGKHILTIKEGAAFYMNGIGAPPSALADSGGLGAFSSVSISDDGSILWATTVNDKICTINGAGVTGSWERVSGSASFIHMCGSGQHFVAVNPKGIVFTRGGYTGKWGKAGTPGGGAVQANMTDNKEVWAVTKNNEVFYYNGEWKSIDGQTGTHVSVSSCGSHVALVGTDGNIYYRPGVDGAWSLLTSSGGYSSCSIASSNIDPAAIAAAEEAFNAIAAAEANVTSANATMASAEENSSAAAAAATSAEAEVEAAKAAWEAAVAAAAVATAEAEAKAGEVSAAAEGKAEAEAALAAAIALALTSADAANMGDDERYAKYK